MVITCHWNALTSGMTDKKYKIKEIFYSIQGEGFNMGKPAIFIRFSGCNLWSRAEKDRENAVCQFGDTEFKSKDGEKEGIYYYLT